MWCIFVLTCTPRFPSKAIKASGVPFLLLLLNCLSLCSVFDFIYLFIFIKSPFASRSGHCRRLQSFGGSQGITRKVNSPTILFFLQIISVENQQWRENWSLRQAWEKFLARMTFSSTWLAGAEISFFAYVVGMAFCHFDKAASRNCNERCIAGTSFSLVSWVRHIVKIRERCVSLK